MNLVLTGSTSGIGWETLRELLPHFEFVILPVRNTQKAQKMIEGLSEKEKIKVVSMDLSEMKSVKDAAEEILKLTDQIDVLINNAGGMFPAKKRTNENLDLTFATNHLGHFLLTLNLLPALKKGKAKIINVSSVAHQISGDPSDDFGLKKSPNSLSAYGKVKLYNILFTNELKNRFGSDGVSAFSLHPGVVNTAFGSDTSGISKALIRVSQLFFISPKAGAQTSVFLALTPKDKLRNGSYYIRKKPRTPSLLALNQKLANELWEYSLSVLSELKC